LSLLSGSRRGTRRGRRVDCPEMLELFALDDAAKATIALIAVFGVVFPALATGLIAFAIAQAAAERQENLERRARRRRD
jgi:hypothetical protein